MITYYNSIANLPLYNWYMLQETGEHKWLLKDFGYNFPKNVDEVKIWADICQEFIDHFGLTESQKEWYNLRKETTKLMLQVSDGQKELTSFIKINQLKMDEMIKNLKGGDFFMNISAVSKAMNIQINPLTTTVLMFFNHVKFLETQK